MRGIGEEALTTQEPFGAYEIDFGFFEVKSGRAFEFLDMAYLSLRIVDQNLIDNLIFVTNFLDLRTLNNLQIRLGGNTDTAQHTTKSLMIQNLLAAKIDQEDPVGGDRHQRRLSRFIGLNLGKNKL